MLIAVETSTIPAQEHALVCTSHRRRPASPACCSQSPCCSADAQRRPLRSSPPQRQPTRPQRRHLHLPPQLSSPVPSPNCLHLSHPPQCPYDPTRICLRLSMR